MQIYPLTNFVFAYVANDFSIVQIENESTIYIFFQCKMDVCRNEFKTSLSLRIFKIFPFFALTKNCIFFPVALRLDCMHSVLRSVSVDLRAKFFEFKCTAFKGKWNRIKINSIGQMPFDSVEMLARIAAFQHLAIKSSEPTSYLQNNTKHIVRDH